MTVVEPIRTPTAASAPDTRVCHILDPQYRALCFALVTNLDVHYTDPTGPLCEGCGLPLCERCVEINETLGDAA